MKASDLLAGITKAATYNMILQLTIRVMTFLLNAFILRFISKDLLGVVNVRLMLLYSTTLFLAKEAFDRACLSNIEKKNWRQVINLVWCSVPVAVLCCGSLGVIWMYLLDSPDSTVVPYYNIGVICFSVSTLIEVVAEPLWVVGQAFLFVKLKVILLGFSQAIKCVVTIVLVLSFPEWGLINFCIAQVISVISYVIMYYGYFLQYIRHINKRDDDFPLTKIEHFFPRHIEGEPFIDQRLARLTWSFFKQSFLKQILTEGERFVMTFLDVLSFADQGIYDVINNLGSMAARFIFLPIEENSYFFFSQSLTRGLPAKQQSQESLAFCSQVLEALLKTVILIGSVILVFGFSFSFLALDLYGGNILSSGTGPMLLRWYCLYVLVIAVNGTTEGFVFAAMSQEQVDKYNKKMLVFSVLFLLSSWLLTRHFGSVGFIIANCLNMLARIVHSIYFIMNYFKECQHKALNSCIPSFPVLITLMLSFFVTYVSEATFCCDKGISGRIIHTGVGGVCGMLVLVVIYRTENSLVTFVKDQYQSQCKLQTAKQR